MSLCSGFDALLIAFDWRRANIKRTPCGVGDATTCRQRQQRQTYLLDAASWESVAGRDQECLISCRIHLILHRHYCYCSISVAISSSFESIHWLISYSAWWMLSTRSACFAIADALSSSLALILHPRRIFLSMRRRSVAHSIVDCHCCHLSPFDFLSAYDLGEALKGVG